MSRVLAAAAALVVAVAGRAVASPKNAASAIVPGSAPFGVVRIDPPATPDTVSPYIYLNRCTGGCTVTGTGGGGANDATAEPIVSSIPASGTYTVGEFATVNGQCSVTTSMACNGPGICPGTETCVVTGPVADAEWAQVVQCVKEVYSPFAVTVTDQRPSVDSFTEAVVAGQPDDLGLGTDFLGVSPSACTPHNNLPVFAFANHHPAMDRVNNICWTAAQETAHAFGLDHEYSFVTAFPENQNSACMDPMTYRIDCGGEKFFRNALANDGRYSTSDYSCSFSQQNSHQQLLTVLGAGTPITAPPTIVITYPTTDAVPHEVVSTASAQRGIFAVELWLNGFKWDSVPAAPFGPEGQGSASYTNPWPNGVPNGYIDIVTKAYDDIGVETDSATVTVLQGAPCQDASTDCAVGQMCANGRCFWNPPTGELGDACTYPQQCMSDVCQGGAGDEKCTTQCDPTKDNVCPSGYDCVEASSTVGYCFVAAPGGCCSAAHGGDGWVPAGLAVVVFGFVGRRRRLRSPSVTNPADRAAHL